MIEKLKWYAIEFGLKKYAPVGIMAGMAALGTFFAAHADMLEQWGVNYIPSWDVSWLAAHPISGAVLLIELDTTSAAVIVLAISLGSMAIRAGQHHTTGTPVVPGGNRASDPPAA